SLAIASPKVWRKWNVHSKPNSQLHHRHCVGKLGDGDGSLLRANRKVLKAECETHEKVLNFCLRVTAQTRIDVVIAGPAFDFETRLRAPCGGHGRAKAEKLRVAGPIALISSSGSALAVHLVV